jgi:hypothetical protein
MTFKVSDEQFFTYCDRLHKNIRESEGKKLELLVPSLVLAQKQATDAYRIMRTMFLQIDFDRKQGVKYVG